MNTIRTCSMIYKYENEEQTIYLINKLINNIIHIFDRFECHNEVKIRVCYSKNLWSML